MSQRPHLDRVPEYSFALAAFVAPPLAVLVPYGMAVELPILGVISALVLWHRGKLGLIPVMPLILGCAFCLWGGITLFWAPDPGHGAITLLRVAALIVLGCCAVGMARLDDGAVFRPLMLGLALGLAVAAVLLAVENWSGHALSAMVAQVRGAKPLPGSFKSQLTRGDAALALFIWPLALVAWRRRSAILASLLVAIFIVGAMGDSLAAGIAATVGIVVLLIVALRPRLASRGLTLILVAAALGLPLAALHFPQPPETFSSLRWLPLSAHHRLVIWRYTADRIAEHPWRGLGMDAARADPGGTDELYIEDRDATGRVLRIVTGARLPLHPHNAILQWWMELGLGGAAILAVFFGWMVRRLEVSPDLGRGDRAALSALLVTGTVISCISYGAWQSWWLASLWLAASFCIASAQPKETVQ